MGGTLKIAAIAVALPLAMAAPAAAASTQTAHSSAPTCGPGGPLYVNAQCITANWAGYLAIGHGPYTAVQAYWQQPATPTQLGKFYAATSIWVGIGGGKQGDAPPVQVGTLMTTGLFGLTTSLQPSYSAVYETPSTGGAETISGFKVSPGDEMAASVSYMNGGFQLYLLDDTTGQSWSSGIIHGNYALDTAEIIVEAPAYDHGKLFYDLAPFGNVQFTDIYIGGVYALQMVRGNKTLVSASLPDFTVTYHSSSLGETPQLQ